MTVLLVTGTRDELNQFAGRFVCDRILDMKPSRVIVGDCPTGVDALVLELCRVTGIPCKPTVADWYPNLYGKLDRSAGPRRNKAMVAEAAALKAQGETVRVLAFPAGKSPGTRGCVKLAEAAGLDVEVTDLSMQLAKLRTFKEKP